MGTRAPIRPVAERDRRADGREGLRSRCTGSHSERSPKGGRMRRLIAVAGLVGSFVLVGFTGWGQAAVGGAHAAQATVPLRVLKAKDGEVLALAVVRIHG